MNIIISLYLAVVGIITGATSKNQRLDIQDKFNEGKIKIIIGSEAIQEGMNLQKKTSDMYLLSLPYNFTSLRQTEGRAWRQGNQWENVRINFMLTNDSMDVFMLQKLQAKQARYMEALDENGILSKPHKIYISTRVYLQKTLPKISTRLIILAKPIYLYFQPLIT